MAESLQKDRENRRALADRARIRKRLSALSPREYEVMTYVIAGLLNKQIAYELGITEDTVKVHRGRVMK
ncbi:MAG: DNA-binding response regulator, partial [Deltaproteobacteria bacterium]|nr:DNA-binding response regulator [Deltaproteobacteria bacterium]